MTGIGGIESADAGKAVAATGGSGGRRVRQAPERGARTLRVPWRERVGDRVAVVGDAPGGPASCRRRCPRRWRRTRPGSDSIRRTGASEADKAREQFADFDLWFERCRVWMGVRERTKATCVLTINEQRLDAYEIGCRLVADGMLGAPEDVYFMTLDDLTLAVESGSVFRGLIDDRRAAQAELERHQEPLFVIAGETVPVAEWPLKEGETGPTDVVDEIVGAAGSPGRMTGRPRGHSGRGRRRTDRARRGARCSDHRPWLDAPLRRRGGGRRRDGRRAQPHDDRAARSRIPAVVGAVGATSAIRTGDLVEVDGSQGVVRILERA